MKRVIQILLYMEYPQTRKTIFFFFLAFFVTLLECNGLLSVCPVIVFGPKLIFIVVNILQFIDVSVILFLCMFLVPCVIYQHIQCELGLSMKSSNKNFEKSCSFLKREPVSQTIYHLHNISQVLFRKKHFVTFFREKRNKIFRKFYEKKNFIKNPSVNIAHFF